MTRYTTPADYEAIYPGEEITQQELDRAADDVNALTLGRAQAYAEDFPKRIWEILTRAVCVQAHFLRAYGAMIDNPLSSYGINGVSMSWRADAVVKREGVTASNETYALLTTAGLTYRGFDWRCPTA